MQYEQTESGDFELCFTREILTKGIYDFVLTIPKYNNTGRKEIQSVFDELESYYSNPHKWGSYYKEIHHVHCFIPAYGFSLIITVMGKDDAKSNNNFQSNYYVVIEGGFKGKLYEVKNVQEYIDVIDELKSEKITREPLFYRGHSKSKYDLMPSIYRGAEDDESLLFKDFLIENYSAWNDTATTLDLLAKMQHYSLSTRLLDISSNPLVALWFATEPKEGDDNEKLADGDSKNDGSVYFFNVKPEKLKYYDEDAMVCLSNLAKLTTSQKNRLTERINYYFFNLTYSSLETKLNTSDFNAVTFFENPHDFIMNAIDLSNLERNDSSKSDLITDFNKNIGYFLNYIKQDKPGFSSAIKPIDLTSAFFVRVIKNNPRLKSQFGAFIIMGLNKFAMNNFSYDLVNIKEEYKVHIRKQLDYLGINEQSLYLELDNSAKYLKSALVRGGRVGGGEAQRYENVCSGNTPIKPRYE